MSYLNISVRQLIMDRVGRDTFLPAIQREYVWNPYQVEMLFDSLLNGYPINSFLFWKIREEHKNDWISYDFIRDYDAEKPHASSRPSSFPRYSSRCCFRSFFTILESLSCL